MTEEHESAPQGDLLETRQALVANWGVSPGSPDDQTLNWKLLLEALAERVLWLLRHNPDKLVNAMYVLDISEDRYAKAMGQAHSEAKALALARAILDRESEKIAMRRKYANRQGDYLAGLYDETDARDHPNQPRLPREDEIDD